MKRLMTEVQLNLFVTRALISRGKCSIELTYLLFQVMGFQDDVDEICQIQHVVAKWWRPNFEAPIVGHLPRALKGQ